MEWICFRHRHHHHRPVSIIQFWITKGTRINFSSVIRIFFFFRFLCVTEPNGQSGLCIAVSLNEQAKKAFQNQAQTHTHKMCEYLWQWNDGPDAIISIVVCCFYFLSSFCFVLLSFLLFFLLYALKFIYKHIFRRCHFQIVHDAIFIIIYLRKSLMTLLFTASIFFLFSGWCLIFIPRLS